MEENKKDEVKNVKEENNELRKGFFKKVWYSITKIEKYPHMATEGFGRAISYLTKIVAILAIVLCLGMIYQTHGILQEGIQYLQDEFPEFSYNDGSLKIESENPIIISEEDSYAGKTIIDTQTTDESKINQYINDITETGSGIIVLNNKIIIKNSAVVGTISYNYKETLEPLKVNEFKKQDIINYANSSQIISVYISLFLTLFVYSFIIYFLTTISNVIFLSFFGYITTMLAKIKMRYVAIFNMSVYAITLSVILNTLYIAVNIFIPFSMEYFQVMYTAVAAIYLVAAILILKSELIKRQMELMKIAETQELVRKEIMDKEREEKELKEKEERKKKDKEKKEDNEGEAPEGSKA